MGKQGVGMKKLTEWLQEDTDRTSVGGGILFPPLQHEMEQARHNLYVQ